MNHYMAVTNTAAFAKIMVKTIARTYETTDNYKLGPSPAHHPHVLKAGHKTIFFVHILVCTQGIWPTIRSFTIKKGSTLLLDIVLKLFPQVFQSLFLQPSNYSTLQTQKSWCWYSQDVSMLGHLELKVQSTSNGSSATSDSKSHGNY